ncbi:hypothetical protein BDZ97DRAFT_1934534 [Flammula alnicola]|nr:hypothetical protein BDZ97DRAFT_1934534 [Flammula alnicola]
MRKDSFVEHRNTAISTRVATIIALNSTAEREKEDGDVLAQPNPETSISRRAFSAVHTHTEWNIRSGTPRNWSGDQAAMSNCTEFRQNTLSVVGFCSALQIAGSCPSCSSEIMHVEREVRSYHYKTSRDGVVYSIWEHGDDKRNENVHDHRELDGVDEPVKQRSEASAHSLGTGDILPGSIPLADISATLENPQ